MAVLQEEMDRMKAIHDVEIASLKEMSNKMIEDLQAQHMQFTGY